MREEIMAVEAAKMILHRQPRAGGETSIDITDQPVDALLELVIFGNFHSARHYDLDQHNAASQFRVKVQSSAKCAQAFGNSLAVIEPVRTENQLTPGKSDPQALRSLLDRFGLRTVFK